jgi:ribonucleoside-diphosphate reductase alpha chain
MSRYVFYIEDNMQSIITRGICDNSFIAKWRGGIAGSWNHVCEKVR